LVEGHDGMISLIDYRPLLSDERAIAVTNAQAQRKQTLVNN